MSTYGSCPRKTEHTHINQPEPTVEPFNFVEQYSTPISYTKMPRDANFGSFAKELRQNTQKKINVLTQGKEKIVRLSLVERSFVERSFTVLLSSVFSRTET